MKTVNIKLANIQRDIRSNEVTHKQISELDETVPTYVSIGKTYVLADKKNVQSRLETDSESLKKSQKDLGDRKQYLERRINSNTINIKELIGN